MTRLRSLLSDAFWLAFTAAILVGGYVGFKTLEALKPEVVAEPPEQQITIVDTRALTPQSAPLPIRGEGFIEPFREVALAAQVSGRIVELHPALDTQGTFRKGDVLVRLDDRSARASLAQTRANIAATEARLDLNRTQLTRTEELRTRGVVPQEQLDTLLSNRAELTATLESLRAAAEAAEIGLSETEIRAPFDGRVMEKQAELGAVVSPGLAIATIYTDRNLEITVPIRQSEAALIPGLFEGSAARAVVTTDFAGQTLSWPAEVARVGNELDSRTRTIEVTLRLDATAATAGGGAAPALINAFAEAVIEGVVRPGLYAIPSTALQDGNAIWLADNGALRRAPATVVHIDGEESYVALADLPSGATLVVSPLAAPVDGLPVRDSATKQTAELTELGQ